MIPNDLIIVIGREFGSGGRSIGHKLAQRLSVPYFDKELLKKAADSLGFSTDIFSMADEKRPSFLNRMVSQAYGLADGFSKGTLSNEGIYEAQSNVIRALAEKGGCVIVGRTADYILRHHPHLVSIFLHSPIEKRIKNVISRGEGTIPGKCKDFIQKKDRSREAYYNYFTARKWGSASNYDLCLDSSVLAEDEIVDIICHYAEAKFKTKK